MDRTLASTATLPFLSRVRRSPDDLALRRELRIDLLRRNAFEFLTAVLGLLAVPMILLGRGLHASAVGHMTASLAPFWLALYTLGVLFIIVGLLKLSPRAEIIGLVLFTASMVTDGIAVLVYSGGGGAAGAMVFLALGLASLWRVHLVWLVVDAAQHRTGEHAR